MQAWRGELMIRQYFWHGRMATASVQSENGTKRVGASRFASVEYPTCTLSSRLVFGSAANMSLLKASARWQVSAPVWVKSER